MEPLARANRQIPMHTYNTRTKAAKAALRAIRKARNGEAVIHGRRFLRIHSWGTLRGCKFTEDGEIA